MKSFNKPLFIILSAAFIFFIVSESFSFYLGLEDAKINTYEKDKLILKNLTTAQAKM